MVTATSDNKQWEKKGSWPIEANCFGPKAALERQYYCSCAAASLDYQMSLHGGSTESELNKRRRSCVVFDGGLEDLPGVFTNLRAEQWYVFTIVRVRSVEFLHVQTAQAPSAGRDFVPLNPPGTTEYHPCLFFVHELVPRYSTAETFQTSLRSTTKNDSSYGVCKVKTSKTRRMQNRTQRHVDEQSLAKGTASRTPNEPCTTTYGVLWFPPRFAPYGLLGLQLWPFGRSLGVFFYALTCRTT